MVLDGKQQMISAKEASKPLIYLSGQLSANLVICSYALAFKQCNSEIHPIYLISIPDGQLYPAEKPAHFKFELKMT